MTLNELIKKATAIARRYTTGDIPLKIYGTEIDVTLTEQGENGNYYIEVNYTPTPKEKPREIRMRAVTPMGSDCTMGYVVDGAEGMTVREFITYICTNNKNERGHFDIKYADDGETYGTLMRIEYSHGNIDARHLSDKNYEKAMNAIVDNINAGGGWGAMDYGIYTKIER